jgi:hypothetical protein
MLRRSIAVFASAATLCCLSAAVLGHTRTPVSVEIVAADGRTLEQIPTASRDRDVTRRYLQAERGERYRIRVRNRSGERLGLVIAVDGRNIISGERSELASTEPMYILDAWGAANYSGWRADLDHVNEFYFTDWPDSYAEAFGDASARGVIAVAVYSEQHRLVAPAAKSQARPAPRSAPEAVAESAASHDAAGSTTQSARAEAGTGYGDRRDESVRVVAFDPVPRERSRVLIKYEWREDLCRLRVIRCEAGDNRLWDEGLSFAPPPPRRR